MRAMPSLQAAQLANLLQSAGMYPWRDYLYALIVMAPWAFFLRGVLRGAEERT
jgi:hypothetical protein